MHLRRWVWACLVLGACSSPLSLADYPDWYHYALCQYYTRCGTFPDVQTCLSANVGVEAYLGPNGQAAVDMGTIVYDGEAAQRCVDLIGARTCDTTAESGRMPAPCSDIFHGTVGAGGECTFDGECASRTCNVPTCSMACCHGTCTGDAPPAPAGPGTPCMDTIDCGTGSFCDYSGASPVCALKGVARPCQATEECAYNLGCAGLLSEMTCRPLPGLGEACPDGVCRDYGDYCSSDGICKHRGLAGAACASDQECSPFYPCDLTTRQCMKAPTTGQPCTPPENCFDPDTFCDTTQAQPVCMPHRADGSACTRNFDCKSRNCDQTGTCAEPAVCI